MKLPSTAPIPPMSALTVGMVLILLVMMVLVGVMVMRMVGMKSYLPVIARRMPAILPLSSPVASIIPGAMARVEHRPFAERVIIEIIGRHSLHFHIFGPGPLHRPLVRDLFLLHLLCRFLLRIRRCGTAASHQI